jgi:hypothetical protein
MRDRQPGHPPAVLVCRGCCCGTTDKHPDVDHEGHLDRFRDLEHQGQAVLKVIDCLNNCDNSNTIVVRPSRAGRQGGGRVTWFGKVLDDAAAHSLAAWVADGGPGVAPVPAELAPHHQPPPAKDIPDVAVD